MKPLIMPFKGRMPKVGNDVFIAPTAAVIGDVEIGDTSSIWFGVTLRGDVHEIRVGSGTNIQDGTVVHVTGGKFGTYIGDNVTIGHNATIHACTLEDGAFIGMGAIILDGAVVEGGAMVAAGAIVTPGKRVKRGEMWGGNPARLMRQMSEEEIKAFAWSAPHYVEEAAHYLAQARTR